MKKEKISQLAQLEQFTGVGKTRAKKLIAHFGSAGKAINGDLAEIQLIFGKKVGEKIFNSLNGEEIDKKLGRSSEYSTDIGESIAKMYSLGKDSIADIMLHHGFSEQTFYNWLDVNLEFFELIKRAKKIRRGRKTELATQGLEKLLTGYEVTEQTTITVPVKKKDGEKETRIKETRISQKHIPPNATMIIFSLVNSTKDDDDPMQHIQHIEYSKGGEIPPYDFSGFSDEELEVFDKLTKKAMSNGTGT